MCREIPMTKVVRLWNGPSFRGVKPVLVAFQVSILELFGMTTDNVTIGVTILGMTALKSWPPYADYTYADCRICWLSCCLRLGVVFADCHICWLSYMLTVVYADCRICWLSYILTVLFFKAGCRYSDCRAEFLLRLLGGDWADMLV